MRAGGARWRGTPRGWSVAATAVVGVLVVVPAAAGAASAATHPVTLSIDATAQVVVADRAGPDPLFVGPPADEVRPGRFTATLAVVDGRPVELPPGAAPQTRTGDRLRLSVAAPYGTSARRAGERLAARDTASARLLGVTTATTATTATRSAASAAVTRTPMPTTGAHTLTVLPISWTSPDVTITDLRTLAVTTAAFWTNQSGGRMTVTPTVKPWKSVPATSALSSCSYLSILTAALDANPGVTPGARNHVLVYFPRVPACGWAGLGYVGGGVLWDNGYLLPDVPAHEFGHNLGLGHANAYQCADASSWMVSLSHDCSTYEYQDSADVMGLARYGRPTGNANAAEADYLGFLRYTDVDPDALTGAATLTITALNAVTSVRGVRIPVPAHSPDLPQGGTLYLEYRNGVGADSRTSWTGVMAHLSIPGRSDPVGSPWTQLLTMRPWTGATRAADSFEPDGWADPTLPVGSSWRVPGTTVSVRVQTRTATTATVVVADLTADLTPPSQVTVSGPAAGTAAAAGSRITWPAASDAGSGVAQYQLFLDGRREAVLGPTVRSYPLPLLGLGTHTVRVDAVDGAGHVRTGATTSFRVADNGVAPPQVRAAGTASWFPRQVPLVVSGDPGQRFDVLLDGARVATLPSGPDGVTLPVTAAADGVHTVTVRSVSAQGRTLRTARTAVSVDGTRPAWTPAASVRQVVSAAGATVTGLRVVWAPATDAGSGLRGYDVSVDGGPLVRAASGATSAVVPVSGVPGTLAGPHSVRVRVRDVAGNVRTVTLPVTVDTVRPTAPVLTVERADGVIVTVSFSASSDAGSGVAWYQVLRDGVAYGPRIGPAAARTATVAAPEGTATVGVRVADRAGLWRVVTASVPA